MDKAIIYQANRLRFWWLQYQVNPQTWKQHNHLLNWAENVAVNSHQFEKASSFLNSPDPVVKLGYQLRQQAKQHFFDSYAKSPLRILLHLPPSQLSPGGYSLFNNLLQSIAFLGVRIQPLKWNENISAVLKKFRPNIFLTSDSRLFLDQVDWSELASYRQKNKLLLALTASLTEYGNTPLADRLKWAKEHHVDFYYSFRSPEYLKNRKAYKPFFAHGYQIISVEFGANPLIYYPLPNIERDLPYIFLASSNADKWTRYFDYLPPIINAYPGLIDGPGWLRAKKWAIPEIHRYLYARAKVGINLHIQDSIDWASELNERTYILAASGVPQIVDNAKLLAERFSPGSFAIASNPRSYYELFLELQENQQLAQKYALKALREVYRKHTTFHRAFDFIKSISPLFTKEV